MNGLRRTARSPRQGAARRGAVMIVAMVCLLLVTLILGSLLKLARTYHGQMQWEETRLQAQWLAESAVERAVNRLEVDPDYAGESWEVPAAELDGRHAGQAQITVEAMPGSAEQRSVQVEAVFPADAQKFVKRSKQVIYQVESSDRE